MHTSRLRPLRRLVATAAAAAAMLTVAVPPPPAAAAPSPSAAACPGSLVPAGGFADTAASAHRSNIDCLVWWQVTAGTAAGRYAPAASLTRAQMAAMLARLLEQAGVERAAVPSAGFVDVDGGPHAANIDWLVDRGVVNGVADDRFAPARPVLRAQMASMLARMHEQVFDRTVEPADVGFTDVSGVHADNIRKLVALGVTTGVTADRFAPSQTVTRGQMASFLMRYAGTLVDAGLAEVPDPDQTPDPGPDPDPDPTPAPGPAPSLTPVCRELAVRAESMFNGPVAAAVDPAHRKSTGYGGCEMVHAFDYPDDPSFARYRLYGGEIPVSMYTPSGEVLDDLSHLPEEFFTDSWPWARVDEGYSFCRDSYCEVGALYQGRAYRFRYTRPGPLHPWDAETLFSRLLESLAKL